MDRKTHFLMPGGDPHRLSAEEFNGLLKHCKHIGASDIYLKTGRPVVARVHGKLFNITRKRLEHPEVMEAVNHMYGGANAELQLRQSKPIDQAYSLKVARGDVLRFRWCATGVLVGGSFGASVVMRELADIPRKLDRSELHPALAAALWPHDGLVLVTGETGAGKSTLLASIIREIGEDPEADTHVITYEAPIEYVYDKVQTGAAEIDQCAIPTDVASFAEGVRNALRRDPDVILIGESRDAETIKAAVLAAQTGHTVYTTVHSNSVGTTFLRLIQALPVDEMYSIMGSILDAIRVIVSQQLVPSTDGKRVAVREFLVFTPALRRELLSVAASNMSKLPSHAAGLVKLHGQTKSQHAELLYAAGRIEKVQLDLIRAAEGETQEMEADYEPA